MPSSSPNGIDFICNWLSNREPGEIKRVLDIGPGFGKWGFLCRLYLQIYRKQLTKADLKSFRDKLTIDAIEIYPPYIQELQQQIYNTIIQGSATEILPAVEKYDLIIMGDVLEHVPLAEGMKILETARAKAKYVLIVMPIKFYPGQNIAGNEAEKHQHVWTHEEWPDEPQIILQHTSQIVLYKRKNA